MIEARRRAPMNVPDVSHPIWREIVTGRSPRTFEHLALQLFLGKARILLAQNNADRIVEQLVSEIHALFQQNASHPKIQRDVAKILG
jgi:hypothetical protein